MFAHPYENMSTADALALLSGNSSVPISKCTNGWDYDREQYDTSLTMEVSLNMCFSTRSAARFHEISSATLNDVIWSTNVPRNHCHPEKLGEQQKSLEENVTTFNSLRPSDAYTRQ